MGKKFISYLVSHRPTLIQIIIAVATVSITIYAYTCISGNFIKQWNDWINIVITFATLVIAGFVWINETRVKWEHSLPKKLDVEYVLNGEKYATVTNAPLAGEDDVRNWGLSIGQTILNDKVSISFSGFKAEGPQRNRKRHILQYKLTVYLTEHISNIPKASVFTFTDNGDLTDETKQMAKKIRKDKPAEEKPGTKI
jgi:hypothetical protein